jgi:hypothetical protein
VRPLRFTAPTGRLCGLYRSSAGFAGLPRGVGEVIFTRTPVAFVEVSFRKFLALARDKALLG